MRVPSVEEEDRRRLIRERDSLLAARQRGLNRIKGLLYLHGIFDLQPKARDLIPRLLDTPTGYGEPFPPHTLAQIGRIKDNLNQINEHIAIVEAQRDAMVKAGTEADPGTVEKMAATLTQVRGIGTNDATLLATEVFSRDFQNRR